MVAAMAFSSGATGLLPAYQGGTQAAASVATGRLKQGEVSAGVAPGVSIGVVNSGYAALQSRQDALNDLAKSIRERNAQDTPHKMFPPYPPEQEQRMALIDGLGGVRSQIESLATTTPDRAAHGAGGLQGGEIERLVNVLSRQAQDYFSNSISSGSISLNRAVLETVA